MEGNDNQYGAHMSSRPRNVEEITKAAQNYEYNASVGIRYWLRTAAEIYEREGNEEQAYFLLFRHAHLVLANLAAHTDARDPALKKAFTEAQREVNKNLEKLEVLKSSINQRHNRYLQLQRQREASKSVPHPIAALAPDPIDSEREGTRHIEGHDNQDLAIRLAQSEMSRRAATRKAAASDLSQNLQQVRAGIDSNGNHGYGNTKHESRTHSTYNYPSIPAHHKDSGRLPIRLASDSGPLKMPPPPLPPKPVGPVVPPKESSTQTGPKPVDTSYTFAATAWLESGTPLRTLFLPPTLRTTFLRLAYKNTTLNLETCGFLAGTLISNALFVSKLIVPSQKATSDTCEMTNESQLFDYVDSEPDLIVLGWIHTHPTQTCFMSSRDLHTHAGYQMMLAESVAIVCAPSKGDTTHGGDWGVYRLTDPPGKRAILACQKPGIFHHHDVENVYTDAVRPGHVVEAKGLEFDVIDLREK